MVINPKDKSVFVRFYQGSQTYIHSIGANNVRRQTAILTGIPASSPCQNNGVRCSRLRTVHLAQGLLVADNLFQLRSPPTHPPIEPSSLAQILAGERAVILSASGPSVIWIVLCEPFPRGLNNTVGTGCR